MQAVYGGFHARARLPSLPNKPAAVTAAKLSRAVECLCCPASTQEAGLLLSVWAGIFWLISASSGSGRTSGCTVSMSFCVPCPAQRQLLSCCCRVLGCQLKARACRYDILCCLTCGSCGVHRGVCSKHRAAVPFCMLIRDLLGCTADTGSMATP